MEPLTTARMVQDVLDAAIELGASDIHLKMYEGQVTVSCRIAGVVRPLMSFSCLGEELLRRFKALARMDVTVRQSPQEGSFVWDCSSGKVFIRMSALPIYRGESLVMRLLVEQRAILSMSNLGFTDVQLGEVERWLCHRSGLIVVSGRTGVGKTTTLYSLMNELANRGRQVFSLEDPVEIPLPNCRQIEIHERSGVTFHTALRTLLRQDPDVMMIGEIRDEETAQAACRAALSGRLVFATTHASGLPGTVMRLVDFGVPQAVVRDVLSGVIVQHALSRDAGKEQRYTLEAFQSQCIGTVQKHGVRSEMGDVYEAKSFKLEDLQFASSM
ncbi:type II/IV secretion system protein [Alicyclobacillus sacchari]|uniref:Type II/IV secretion system protein n=1 Tax=Alicyclobacillus sacchari TaxID=392010 RepID=A0A4R8LIW8_9BACL|nr:ATPase, T2SS/T4P/T4SS family [Alicyclobacillus sacchari]TDY43372.1 type II/IV secretion system protein [Alicyclobacillus sacchari]GMA55885.1 hypothetical protein GCM10025858_03880 [Alicyclobacillus sacchari]